MYVYGKRIAKELLKNNKEIYKVYLYEHFSDKEIIFSVQKANIEVKYLSKKELDNIEKGNHQGIILDVPEYHYYSFENLINSAPSNPFYVILDHLEDTHNLGAIIRTCEAAGVDGIIIPKDRSVSINSTVMKISSGALDNVKICMVTNLNRIIDKLKENGVWIIGTDLDDSVSYTEVDYNIPMALIIGSEGKGIGRLTKKLCDIVIKIPMKGKINSLNASVAAGIIIYKAIEKRGG